MASSACWPTWASLVAAIGSLARAVRRLAVKRGLEWRIGIAVLCLLGAYLLMGITADPSSYPSLTIYIWLLVGLVLGYANTEAEGSTEARNVTESLSVVHVIWGGGFGGVETFVSDLARVQAAMGIGVGILVCGKDAGAVELDRYRAQGVTVTTGGLRSGFDLRPSALKTITRILSTAQVIHVHGFTPSVSFAIRRAKRPVVFTEHGMLGLEHRLLSLALRNICSRVRSCVAKPQWSLECPNGPLRGLAASTESPVTVFGQCRMAPT